MKKLIEIEDNYEEKLINALDELRKEREENKSLKERIDETKGNFSHF